MCYGKGVFYLVCGPGSQREYFTPFEFHRLYVAFKYILIVFYDGGSLLDLEVLVRGAESSMMTKSLNDALT